MREIRDKITAETQNMTFEELKAYIDKNYWKVKVKTFRSEIIIY